MAELSKQSHQPEQTSQPEIGVPPKTIAPSQTNGELARLEQPEPKPVKEPENPKQGQNSEQLIIAQPENSKQSEPTKTAEPTLQPEEPKHAEQVKQPGQSEQPKIPKTCKAGCVVNAGPNFTVSVEDVPVPEPGMSHFPSFYLRFLFHPFMYILQALYTAIKRPLSFADTAPTGPDEILLRLNATGVCYSDLHYMLEDLPMPRMSEFNCRSPGHEGAGVVVKLGSNVTTWKIGDRGGVKPMWDICMNCELCWDGLHETYCAKAVATGLMQTGWSFFLFSPSITLGYLRVGLSGDGIGVFFFFPFP